MDPADIQTTPRVCIPLKQIDRLGHTSKGHPIFTTRDLAEQLYAVVAVGRGHYPTRLESYIFIPVDSKLVTDFQYNRLSLNALLSSDPDAPWYLINPPTGPADLMTLLCQATPVSKCPFLPLAPEP